MKETNKYGFVSGGWLYDQMDRKALFTLNRVFPVTKKQQIYTSHAKVEYFKQVCNSKDLMIIVPFVDDKEPNEYFVPVDVYYGTTLAAHALFTFKKAEHNYCETKEQKSDSSISGQISEGAPTP